MLMIPTQMKLSVWRKSFRELAHYRKLCPHNSLLNRRINKIYRQEPSPSSLNSQEKLHCLNPVELRLERLDLKVVDQKASKGFEV